MAFSLTNKNLPAPELSMETFDIIHDTLLRMAKDSLTTQPIRDKALELLMEVAVSRGSLAYFLTVVNLLLRTGARNPLSLSDMLWSPASQAKSQTQVTILSVLRKLQGHFADSQSLFLIFDA